MSTQIQRRRGTTAEHSTFTGALAETTIDTDKDTVVVHDGTTVGGHPLMRENGSNSALALGSAGTPSLKFTGDTNTGIYSPGADQVAISTNGSGRLFVNSSGDIGMGTNALINSAGYTTLFLNGSTGGSIGFKTGDVIKQYIYSTGTTLNYYGSGSDSHIFYCNTEKMRLTSTGLGIGTSSPATKLNLVSGTFRIDDGTTALDSFVSAGEAYTGAVTNHKLNFVTNNTVRATLDTSGRLGVGTTSPAATLDAVAESSLALGLRIRGRASDNNGIIQFTDNAASAQTAAITGTSTSSLVFASGSTERLRIDSSGRVGIGTSSPTAKLQVASVSGDGINIDFPGGIVTGNEYSTLRFTASSPGFTGAEIRGIHTNGGANLGVLAFHTSGSERARIDSSGRLGIGTTTPATDVLLTVGGNDTDSGIMLDRSSGDNCAIHNVGGNLVFKNGGNSTVSGLNERARITSSGQLLVGTSSSNPAFASGLQVVGSSSAGTQLIAAFNNNVNGGELYLAKSRSGTVGTNTVVQSGDSLGLIGFYGADGTTYQPGAYIRAEVDATPGAGDLPTRLVFSTTADGASSPTERMRINSDGRVFVACTSSPSASVFGTMLSSNLLSEGNKSSVNTTSANVHWVFFNPNGAVGSISTSGSATSFSTSSDYRLKENVTAVTDGITRLQQLKPSRFNFIADPDKTVDGFIAHEVQSVVPEAISGEKDAVDDEGNPQYQGIDQSKLVPLLTAALQEAVAKIESLEARLTAAGL